MISVAYTFILIALRALQSNCFITDNYLLSAEHHGITSIDLTSGSFKSIPINDNGTIFAIEFDVKQNCLFTVDLRSNSIKRFWLNADKLESFDVIGTIDGAEIEDMSYDWISELLYFIDSRYLKIQLISTSNERQKMHRKILNTGVNSMPKGIVVHPIGGYLIYTDWNPGMPSIIRANLDGSNKRSLIKKPHVIWPMGITIDFNNDRLYWIDAYKKYVGSCDLNGMDFKETIKNEYKIGWPFSIAIHNDVIYWSDDEHGAIFRANRGTN